MAGRGVSGMVSAGWPPVVATTSTSWPARAWRVGMSSWLGSVVMVPWVTCTTGHSAARSSSHQAGGVKSGDGPGRKGPMKWICGGRSLRGYSKEATVPCRYRCGETASLNTPAGDAGRPARARTRL